MLAVCGTLLILTLLLARFSFVFFGVGIVVEDLGAKSSESFLGGVGARGVRGDSEMA